MESQLDEEKYKRMLKKIIDLEKNNANTKDFNDNEMVTRIKKIIEEEEQCY